MFGVVRQIRCRVPWLALALAPWGSACVDELQVGRIGGEAGLTSPPLDAASTTQSDCAPVTCRGRTLACGDCIDNDQDGLTDADDPECLGPCDDTEAWLSTSPRPCPTGDCFFEPNCGGGNDSRCIDLTPNGCDCNGCCALPGGTTTVLLGTVDSDGLATCNNAALDDPSRCAPCEIDLSCFNECGPCELCLGRTSLPASCAGDADCSTPSCEEGRASCGGCAGACAPGTACVTGCCVSLQ
jgi:hypothetical protein